MKHGPETLQRSHRALRHATARTTTAPQLSAALVAQSFCSVRETLGTQSTTTKLGEQNFGCVPEALHTVAGFAIDPPIQVGDGGSELPFAHSPKASRIL